MSVPPAEPSKFTWTDDFPEFLKERALKTMRGLYGKEADGVKIEGYRMCWCLIPFGLYFIYKIIHG